VPVRYVLRAHHAGPRAAGRAFAHVLRSTSGDCRQLPITDAWLRYRATYSAWLYSSAYRISYERSTNGTRAEIWCVVMARNAIRRWKWPQTASRAPPLVRSLRVRSPHISYIIHEANMRLHRNSLRFSILVGLSAVVAGLTAATGPSDKPLCELAQEWVAARGEHLPSTLDQFEQYPLAYRRAIYNELTPDVHALLWQQHLTLILETEPDLSDAQHAFLKHVVQQLPVLMHVTPEEMEAIDEEIVALFPIDEARRIFATLGSVTATGDPTSLRAEGVIIDAFVGGASLTSDGTAAAVNTAYGDCECSASGVNYCWFTYCNTAQCGGSSSGCGSLWRQPCDGTCGGSHPWPTE